MRSSKWKIIKLPIGKWADTDETIEHAVFELLTRYVEDERPYIREDLDKHWCDIDNYQTDPQYHDEVTIRKIYRWWKTYLAECEEVDDIIHAEIDKIIERPIISRTGVQWGCKTEDLPTKDVLFAAMINHEDNMNSTLTKRLHKIIDLRLGMWT
jgi:hypothetical protein